MSVAVLQPVETGTVVSRLEELAERANEEHRCVVRATRSMLEHALRAGQALNEAKATLPSGEWEGWLAQNFHACAGTANTYRRIAKHVELLRRQPDVITVSDAHHFLREMVGRSLDEVDEDRHEAQRLREQGLTTGAIAEHFGVNRSTVTRWLQGTGKYAIHRKRAHRRIAAKAQRANLALIAQRFKAAGDAQRAGDSEAFAGALEDLAEAAWDYARSLRAGSA